MFRKYEENFRIVSAAQGTGSGSSGNPGNFSQDRERASEAGRKGGEHSHGGHSTKETSKSSSSGGEHSARGFAKDPQKASEAGRKGGQASHKS
ncbi:con-10 family general stress protein [Gluconobacter oxydans]|uniref:general stress protein n=1 Tax=Gluconobacter oxydans TaxID=442 RepID=UPI00079203AF|nr:KGG domain-containing protein [Gluconobacter oxydans]KXV65937.1 hypothetical protein AD950_03210 [Gluconobacter oxydans]